MCQIAEELIIRKGESALLKSLIECETNHNYAHASKEVVRKETLQLHVARLFDNPLWVHFVPFNRQYRPEVLETAHLVTVVNECCNTPGEVAQEQVDQSANGMIACPSFPICISFFLPLSDLSGCLFQPFFFILI